MVKYIAVALFVFSVSVRHAHSQSNAINIPGFSGNVNDWESLFTDAQKSSLDSVCTIFAYQTNIPIYVMTFGAANTPKEHTDVFVDQADSILNLNHNYSAYVAIFLSKEFRDLSLKANAPTGLDTAKFADWKTRLQGVFTTCVQPYIPLLKDGKYAEAIIAAVGALAVGVKKEF